MTLQIYNSFTRSKEIFTPLVAGKVNMYVCGMTVYDYCHIGHARVLVCFDVIARYLAECGYSVNYVRNITDIDDKIIRRAEENGESCEELTSRFIKALHEDAQLLQVLPPSQEPKATEYIQPIVQMIQQLLNNGFAYQTKSGDINYSVVKFSNYGMLAHKDLEGLRAGARVEVDMDKQDPLDFVLWKSAKPNEPSWESPWGKGRPGWHIECSAMSTRCLGNHFDIHGGGFDLQFPHHENEIAQTEAATGEKFVNTWMHVGFVQINQEKMSKSLGNFFTIRDVLNEFPAEVVRYFLLASHYRSQLNYAPAALQAAKAALERFYTCLRGIQFSSMCEIDETYKQEFFTAMDDDFNTPEAIAVMFDIAREINRVRDFDSKRVQQLAATLYNLGNVLGILQSDPQTFLQSDHKAKIVEKDILRLIAQREQARKNRDWSESDRIRDHLKDNGVVLEDTASGTLWRRDN